MKETQEERSRRQKMRYRMNVFIKRHGYIKGPCQVCGNEKTQIHHADYDNEFLVNFLCCQCHNDLHSGKIPAPLVVDMSAIYKKLNLSKHKKCGDVINVIKKQIRKRRLLDDNKQIRTEIKKAKLLQWQIADEMEISETDLSRKLRYELEDHYKERVLKAIQILSERKGLK